MVGHKPLETAAQCVKDGGIIAYPTEGVFGIGCNPHDEAALARLIDLKHRDAGKGLILVSGCFAHLDLFIQSIEGPWKSKILASWPGPVTWIVPARGTTSPLLTGGRDTIAVRVSAHAVIAALSSLCDHALVSTSANRSGQPPCTSASEVKNQFGDRLDYIVDAPLGERNQPTDIFDARSGEQLR